MPVGDDILSLRMLLVGAPAYFARNGRPQHPHDLARHECVVRVIDGFPEPWSFAIDGRRSLVRVHGRFRTSSVAATAAVVLRGHGLGVAPLWQIRDPVDRGLIEVVLEAFEVPRIPIQAVFPPTRMPVAKTRALIDVLADRLRTERL